MSIFPEEEVGVGAEPPPHLIVIADPPIWNADGMYPVPP
jgi:hypothetical protein